MKVTSAVKPPEAVTVKTQIGRLGECVRLSFDAHIYCWGCWGAHRVLPKAYNSGSRYVLRFSWIYELHPLSILICEAPLVTWLDCAQIHSTILFVVHPYRSKSGYGLTTMHNSHSILCGSRSGLNWDYCICEFQHCKRGQQSCERPLMRSR